MLNFKSVKLTALGLLLSSQVFAQDDLIKKNLEQQGYNFIQQIDAPEGLIGWSGHKEGYPSTVFISKDQKYYIVGDLFNAQNENLSETAINKHVKTAVMDEIWKSLAQSTWIQDGKPDAAKIVYVFTDVNCPYCHTFWKQARPWVDSGKVQLRHIMVGVIRENSLAQAATVLSATDPAALFKKFNQSNGKDPIQAMQNIPPALRQKLEANAALMDKYEFYATPAVVWRNTNGDIESEQGAPKDLKRIFE